MFKVCKDFEIKLINCLTLNFKKIMKTLELNQMEELQGGGNPSTCAGYGTAVAVTGLIIGGALAVATGGVSLAVGALLGGWLGAGTYGACLFN